MSKAIHVAKNGTRYVYESISYWDKTKKAPRTRQVYLGKLDPVTGELIPKRVAASDQEAMIQPSVRTIGPVALMSHCAQITGLAATLKKVFADDWENILSLAFHICHSGSALSHCESWANDHKVPGTMHFSSQNISRLLKNITEKSRQQFLSLWAKRFSSQESICYDITSVSSYAQSMDYVRYGYNRDREPLPQINLAMLYGQQSRLPVYYRRLPGSISDVSTLKKTIQLLDYAGRDQLSLVMDMGFYSQTNIDDLYARKYKFLMAAPTHRKWVSDLIDEHWQTLNSPGNFRQDGDSTLYAMTQLEKWNGHRCYVHLFYNEMKKAQGNDDFMLKLFQYKEKLEFGLADTERVEFYERFLEISETPVRGRQVRYKDEAVRNYRERHSGIFALISNHEKDAMTALECYRNKDVVEKSFDDLKNEEDCRRLRMHSDQAAEGKLFLGFLALILRSSIANGIRGNKELSQLDVPRLLRELNTLREVTVEHRYRRAITEPTRIQRLIFDSFAINIQDA